jgi:ribosomal protein S18 acetylase RimI-like enzyme
VSNLSSGASVRPATPEDAEGILAVGVARDVEDLGYPDYSLDDVNEELAEADAAWVVAGGSGGILASALLTGGDARVLVHPDACGAGIGTRLLALLEGAARERGERVIRQAVSGRNDPARRLLEAAGYRAEQYYWRMVRDLSEPVAPVAWPDGIEPRAYEPGADDAAAHALVQDAFKEIPGNVERSFDEWRSMSVGGAQFSHELSTVAGDLAGVALCERWDDGQGYVAYLATAGEWRGRGLGRALLAESFAKMRSAGLARAVLNVNGRNEAATRLYRGLGMSEDWRAERYDKVLAAGPAAA